MKFRQRVTRIAPPVKCDCYKLMGLFCIHSIFVFNIEYPRLPSSSLCISLYTDWKKKMLEKLVYAARVTKCLRHKNVSMAFIWKIAEHVGD